MYKNLTDAILTAIDNEWIERADGPRLRRLVSQRGWSLSLVETGLNPRGEDLYAICADYL